MNGRIVMGTMLAFALVFGAVLWWFQTRAFYREVSGVTEIALGDVTVPVSDYRGIDADTSPLKMRACFQMDAALPDMPDASGTAQPLIAPDWFDCFDAATIAADIASGAVQVALAEENTFYGFSLYLARYRDGRAVLWRQMNACGEAAFAGDPLPEGCPARPET